MSTQLKALRWMTFWSSWAIRIMITIYPQFSMASASLKVISPRALKRSFPLISREAVTTFSSLDGPITLPEITCSKQFRMFIRSEMLLEELYGRWRNLVLSWRIFISLVIRLAHTYLVLRDEASSNLLSGHLRWSESLPWTQLDHFSTALHHCLTDHSAKMTVRWYERKLT